MDESQVKSIRILTIICSSISILGLLVVFSLFIFLKNTRTFATELVILLCISNIIFNICFFFPYNKNSDDNWCALQSTLSVFAYLSCMLWSTLIGFTALVSV